jgi:hypothetical protein
MSAVVGFDPLRDKRHQSTRLGRDVADFLAWLELGARRRERSTSTSGTYRAAA